MKIKLIRQINPKIYFGLNFRVKVVDFPSIYMKIIRIYDSRKRVELDENISGSVALSKVRFVFKLFNIKTEQEVIF